MPINPENHGFSPIFESQQSKDQHVALFRTTLYQFVSTELLAVKLTAAHSEKTNFSPNDVLPEYQAMREQLETNLQTLGYTYDSLRMKVNQQLFPETDPQDIDHKDLYTKYQLIKNSFEKGIIPHGSSSRSPDTKDTNRTTQPREPGLSTP